MMLPANKELLYKSSHTTPNNSKFGLITYLLTNSKQLVVRCLEGALLQEVITTNDVTIAI